jgi:hypothetical protein
MKKRKKLIRFEELPKRSINLEKEKLNEIFGGYSCREYDESCNVNCDCCNDLKCALIIVGGGGLCRNGQFS